MKLIIDIDKETFSRVKSAQSVPDMWGTDIVNALNSIRSGIERPKGEWIYKSDSNSITCSKCACTIWSSDIVDGNAHFCPNCGVKMGDKNETNN